MKSATPDVDVSFLSEDAYVKLLSSWINITFLR